jgi:hypothetical protein
VPADTPQSPGRAGRPAPARFRAAAGRSLYVAVVVGALLTLSAWAIASSRPASTVTNTVVDGTLDDDGDGALFQLTNLMPGREEARCITVSNSSPAPAGIRLSGSAGGGLDAYLHLWVDRGTGGHFGDCNGFSGIPVFDDSLSAFVALHHDYDSGLVAYAPLNSTSTTFRLRVELDDVPAAQGGAATASFAWESRSDAIDVVPPPPPPDPTPEPEPAADPVPDPLPPAVEADKPAEKAPATKDRDPDVDRPANDPPATRDPDPTPEPGPPPAPAGVGEPAPPETATDLAAVRAKRDAGRSQSKQRETAAKRAPKTPAAARRHGPAAKEDRGLVDSVVGAIADAIKKVVAPVVQRTAFPLILLILGGLFLLIQNRIDSRDPKLARAPLHAQPDLPFLPPPSPGDDRP